MLLGSHLSISGGLDKALVKADGYGFQSVALFVRNQVQWRVSPLADEAVRRFRSTRKRLGIGPVVAHGSYLVNLAGRDDIRRKSIDAMVADLDRCGRLGIEYLVFHPGAADDVDEEIERIARAMEEIFQRCGRRRPKLLLETTAGQGRSIGHRFEHLAEIRRRCRRRRRVGICLDTCHVFAAGYDVRTPAGWQATLDKLDDAVGLEHLLAVHLNDSKRPLGSRVDRHEHIGKGAIGRRGFVAIVTDRRLAQVPLILETPKGTDEKGRDYDTLNARLLRRLAKGR
jgi:deoxyribonuclease IV